mmetsp:Transcript_38087/g.108752  ORF Transcript_38087/g.108752 Transcript_38087/m.108752 type:complete len:119 (+) Transcript_38087:366-722(+)
MRVSIICLCVLLRAQVPAACLDACVKLHEPQLKCYSIGVPDKLSKPVMDRAVVDSSACGIKRLEGLFAPAMMDTHGHLFSFAKKLMFCRCATSTWPCAMSACWPPRQCTSHARPTRDR